MSSMSASDAAPLPRLGEVFFDVRGSSRSMRLSWYADTGVSVFSIWQGGTCTGTFRLPIEELPRLIDALQRGAQAPDPRGSGAYASQLPGAPTDPRLTALPGGYGGRDVEFTGPVTGDFRAVRPDDPTGTMVLSPAQAQGPRALPAGPLALPPGSGSQTYQAPQPAQDYPEDYAGQYYPEQQYPEQQYQEQQATRTGSPGDGTRPRATATRALRTAASTPSRGATPSPASTPTVVTPSGSTRTPATAASKATATSRYGAEYADRDRGYAGQGYAEPGYGYAEQDYAGQGYSDQGYADQGYGDQGYVDQRYADQAYCRSGLRRAGVR